MKKLLLLLLCCVPFVTKAQWQLDHTFPSAPIEIEVVNNRIYLVTSINGLYSSDDDGQSWQRNMTIPDSILHDFYADEDVLMAAVPGGVLLSFDDGNSWTVSNIGMSNAGIYSVVRSGDNLLCSSFATFSGDDAIIYLSTDNGNSWTEQVNDPNNIGYPELIAKDSIVIASSYSSELYYSGDLGVTFTPMIFPLATENMNFTNSTIVAGTSDGIGKIVYSTDNGQSWQIGIDTVAANDFDNTGDTVYAATWQGFYYSTNAGISWTQYNDGIPSLPRCFAVGAKGSDIWLGHHSGGLYKLTLPQILSVEEHSTANGIKVYPNPVSDNISIELPGNGTPYSIDIYNKAGQKVHHTFSAQSNITLSTKSFAIGLYFIVCTDGVNNLTEKFIKE